MSVRAQMIARLALALGMAFSTFGYSSCSFRSGDGALPGTDDDDEIIGGATFTTTLTLRDSSGTATTRFVMGEPIHFDLEVLNRTSREVNLQFPDGQIYDIYVLASNSSQVLWRWAEDKSFPQLVTQLSFPPDSSKLYAVGWNAALGDGTQLPAGSYRARGVIVSGDFTGDPLAPGELVSPLVNFTVR